MPLSLDLWITDFEKAAINAVKLIFREVPEVVFSPATVSELKRSRKSKYFCFVNGLITVLFFVLV